MKGAEKIAGGFQILSTNLPKEGVIVTLYFGRLPGRLRFTADKENAAATNDNSRFHVVYFNKVSQMKY